jgi:ribosome-binding protein aMBF1 (putative translation factor)
LVVKGLALDSPARSTANPLPRGLHRLLRSTAGSALIARPQSKEPAMDDDTSRAHARERTKVGRAIREVREERGLSQHELADAVRGISLTGLRAIEAGKARRSLDYVRLIRLADALGIELGALMRHADSLDAE